MTDDSTIDPFTGEALLLGHGRVDGDPLSDLLDALGSAPLPSETAGGVSTIGGMVANVSVAVAARAPSSRRRLTTRVGALAAAGSMFLTSVAAAAVGVPVPVVSEVVPEIADLVPGGSGSPDPVPGVADEPDEFDAPTLQDDSVVESTPQPTPSIDDGATTEAEPEPGNSQRGRSDCGKPDAEPSGDPECDEAGNHGEYVSDGKPDDPGSNGNGNGKPEDPGSNGNGNGQPEDPGSNGNGNGQPEDPGSNGNGNGKPEDPGSNGNGPDESNAGGNGNGSDESNAGGNGNGNGDGSDENNAGGNGNGNGSDESNAGGNGNGNGGGGGS